MKQSRQFHQKLEQALENNAYVVELLKQEHHTYTDGILDNFKKPLFIGDVHGHLITSFMGDKGKEVRVIDLERMNLHQLRYKLIVVETEDNFGGFEIVPNGPGSKIPGMMRKENLRKQANSDIDLVFWMRLNKPEVKVFDISDRVKQHLDQLQRKQTASIFCL